jgi:HD-GYP domain-containing protein (c-di-GMP phosphodiesterase class II)
MLVLLLSLGQLLCLLGALLWFAHRVQQTTSDIVRQRTLAASEQFAAQTAALIRQLGLKDLSIGSADWRRLQRFIENNRLPNGGFLCVIDARDGRIICHPELAERPEVADRDMASTILHGPEGDRRLVDLEVGVGWSELPDGTQLIAVRALPELGVRVLAHQHEAPIRAAIGEFTARIRVIGLVITVALALLLALVTWLIVQGYDNRLAEINENLEEIVRRRTAALLQSRSAVILGLAKLAESRDDETGRHLDRIRHYVRILGEQLKGTDPEINEEFVSTISETAALHDIGKVGIPDDVLLKPGRLTDEQRAVIQKHPLIGGDTLLAVKQRWGDDTFLVTACEIAFAHHERWDGKGYPFGLAGDMIPLSGRIVALADVYDALTTDRVYKSAMPHEEAKRIIIEGSGTHFDPRVVQAFLAAEEEFVAVQRELGMEEATERHSDAATKG